MVRAKIYAVDINGYTADSEEEKSVLHYYYLDAEAEYLNGYDICMGNLYAHTCCLAQRVFDATLVLVNGKEEPCVVSSFFDEHSKRMRGYIWLKEDENAQPFINNAIEEYGRLIN